MNTFTRDFPVGSNEPIAIIGMSCNLPGGNRTPDEFWSFLLKKKCGISEVPSDRWGVDVFFDPNPDALAKSVSKWAGFVEDIRGFDAKFFGISPREATGMDPQQRMVLQGAVEAMLDAQIPLEEFSRQRTGVFIGISQSEYRTLQEMRITSAESYAGTGYALCINANRVSHRLNLDGPSYAIDTACSSSLTALDQAVRNIHSGACDLAVVGGVNALTHPSSFLAFSKAGMVSPTGQISTFDASANGFVRGEGVGMVVLKTLSRAIADGDRIHSVIHGTSINQDGATNTITAPNQDAQISMLRDLFESVDITPDQIGFVEAHGTGTPIGDPIEAGAIGTVIGQQSPDRPVYIGSGKANVGHLESGAGITGLIKATMAVKAGIVPPNIHFKNPNPYIPFDALNLQVPVQPEDFPQSEGRRYAVVNSFGFGGANACALISSPPSAGFDHHPMPAAATSALATGDAPGFPYFFPVSGATQDALQANAAVLLKSLRSNGSLAGADLADISAALATKRSHLMYRALILARTQKELKTALRRLSAGDSNVPNIATGQIQNNRRLCFTFSGQGSQWWGMARGLLEHNATFTAAVDAFDRHFIPVAGWSIKEELLKDAATTRIDDTTVTQPALFAIQVGLAAVWRQFGVTPDMVVGHSIGEAAASYLAGGLSLSGAAKFLSKRGVIRDQLGAQGAMAAIGLHHVDVEAMLPDDGTIGIAAINGPGSTTISGDFDAIHAFVEDFQITRPDTFIRALTVDTAWHSYHLDAGEAWFRKEMSAIDWSVPDIPFISTVTAKPETRFDTDYGWLNLRRPVLFQGAVETAIGMGATTFLELGPAATLAGPAKSTALEAGATVAVLNSLNRKDADYDVMARAAAALFVQGHPLDWDAITGTPKSHVDLPPYAWNEEEFWQDSEESRGLLYHRIKHPFLGQRERGNGTTWSSEINLKAYAYLKDHRMQSDTLFPAAAYIDTIIAVGRELFGDDKVIEIENSVIHEALFIAPDDEVLLSSIYDPDRGKVALYSRVRDAEDDWVLRSEARLRVSDAKAPPPRVFDENKKGVVPIDIAYAYDVDGNSNFINYGDAFQTIENLWMTPSKTIARIVLSDGAKSTNARHYVHPTMLDGCLQILEPRMTLKRMRRGRQPGDLVCLPVGVGRIRVFADFPDEVFVEADQFKEGDANDPTAGFTVRDAAGNVIMTVTDMKIRTLPSTMVDVKDDDIPAHFVRQDIVELRDAPTEKPATGKWLLLEGGAPTDAALAHAMTAQGADVQRVNRAEMGDDMAGALTDLAGDAIEAGTLDGIAIAWPLALPEIAESTGTDALFAPLDICTKDLIAIGDLMDYARSGTHGLPDIVILTSGAYPDPSADGVAPAILSQMPMAALARGLATETPEYNVRVIDADAGNLLAPLDLATRILTPSPESEIILKGDKCFAPRLHNVAPDDFDPKMLTVTAADMTTNFHATMRTPGVIDHVRLEEIPLEPMGADQVRVRIAAVGLNFRDIMAVTGLLPIEAEPEPAWQNLGLEFGAVVDAVGANVADFKPGDRVMGLGKRCLQRFKTVDPRTLTLLPEHISLVQAATIPSAFATAHYALNHVGRMRKGEKVFIHVATGGVGTAAVQLAQAAGAEIFATAGNPDKRRLLRDLGVDHVMDSRTLKFADDVMKITKGTGVDILLNSLPGEYIIKGLEIMAPYGRYLEIGKRDVYEDASIGMKALRRNVSLSVLDLAAMGMERPELMAQMFGELFEMLDTQALAPLPFTAFPAHQISDAIRYMSQAKHVGKVVVTLEDEAFQVRRDVDRPVTLSQNASYLITGGTGGFSLSIADWLSKAGAGQLVLASRSGRIDAAGERFVEKLKARGTGVSVLALDVTDADAVTTYVAESLASDMPLKGVVHGAAVIKDGFANQLTPDMISDVLSPKIRGGWNLHQAFAKAGVDPDFMIGFSSISQVIGSAGQCNYIAGNAFLDALAYYRVALGRTGTAIDWGAIADAGFVARNSSLGSYLESVGLHGLRQAETGAAMDLAIARDAPSFVYSRADWPQIVRANPALGTSPRLATVLKSDTGGTQEVRIRLMQLEGDALIEGARDYIMDEITNVLKIDKSTIQIERPMSELGLDSLSSFELKIRIETALDFSLPVSKFLQAPSVGELSEMLATEIESIRRAEAAELARQDGADETGGDVTADQGMRASNRQVGLRRDALAFMTSDQARHAMEYNATATLPDGMTIKDLRKVLRKLQRRHPMLMLRISDGGRMYHDGPGPNVVDGQADGPLDIANDEYVRVLADPTDDGLTITLRMHMAVGDQASCDLLAEEIREASSGATLPKPTPKRAVISAVQANGFDGEHPQSQNDRSFWFYNLSAGAPAVPFAKRSRPVLPPNAGRDHGPAHHIDGHLPGQPDEATVMTALAAALRKVTHSTGAVIMGRASSLRSELPAGAAIGPFEIEHPMRVPHDPQDKIAMAGLRRMLTSAHRHGAFDSYAAGAEFADYFAGWKSTPFQILCNLQADMDRPAPTRVLHDLTLIADLSGNSTAFRLIFDCDVMNVDTANAISDALVAQLDVGVGAHLAEPETV